MERKNMRPALVEEGGPGEPFHVRANDNAETTARQDFMTPRSRKEQFMISRKMSEVEREALVWLWPGVLPAGTLILLEGDPGIGKSLLTLDLIARMTTGRRFPFEGRGAVHTPADALLISYEDHPAQTISPRLEAAGADLTRVHLLEGTRKGQEESLFTLGADQIPLLEEKIIETKARIVVIDPLAAALPLKIDSHKDAQVRSTLSPLTKLAQRTGATILAIRHLTKDETKTNPSYRGGGSIGFTGAARAVFLVGRTPNNPDQLVMAPVKFNLGAEPPSLSFQIQIDGAGRPYLYWLGMSEYSAGDLLGPAPDRKSGGGAKFHEARMFLKKFLRDGPVQEKLIEKAATELGLSSTTLKRAKADLGILSTKTGGRGYDWNWRLPSEEEPEGTPEAEGRGVPSGLRNFKEDHASYTPEN